MRILFLHDNFPAQFGAFGQYLSANGWEVWFGTRRKGSSLDGIRVFNYEPHRAPAEKIHPAAVGYEQAVLNGQAVARACLHLKRGGFTPDIVMAHSGWGPGLFVKDVWPTTKYVGYFEWYYRSDAPDLVFMSPKEQSIDERIRTRGRNAAILADLAACDFGICPTQFQKDQFPACFHDKLTVMHEGVDTDFHRPERTMKADVAGIGVISELITYVARGLEPYRGFPEFMSALEIVLAERPNAHAMIVGEDRVAYGAKLPPGDSYKKRALAANKLDWRRVHFTDLLPRSQYLKVLQSSSVHAYLSVPFVLSWSMLEAMSAGCAVVASDVEPVHEVSRLNPDAIRLVDPRDPEAVARAISETLANLEGARQRGDAARRVVETNYAARDLFARKALLLRRMLG